MFSDLTNVKILTNNYDSRNGAKIDKITIHHMAGNLTVEQCGNVFKNKEASANYGIDNQGRIGGYVPEEYRAWSTANYENDKRAINIELANDGGAETNWHVSDVVINKCIELCVDICKRYKINKLNYTNDKNGNLTRHNFFVNTTCPGPYLQSKFPYIAEQVNKRLETKEETPATPSVDILELVKKTIRGDFGNGEERKKALGANFDEVQRQVNLNYENGTTRWDNIRIY